MSDIDLGYILGHQDEYEELRFSLRSLTNFAHRKVWIAGAPPPDWCVGVNYIPVTQLINEEKGRLTYEERKTNQRTNLLAICDHPDVSQGFVFMNDDFFFVEPISGPGLPPPPHLGTYTETHRNMAEVAGAYQKLYYWMQEHTDVGEPLHVPEHVPMVMDKTLLAEWMREVWHIHGFPVASLWSNRANIDSYRGPDFILKRDFHRETWPEGQWAVSTVNRSFFEWPVGQKLRDMFPDPSPYER